MIDLSSMKSLLSDKSLTELCTLKNAYELLTGKDLDSVEGELATYLKSQLKTTEDGILDIVAGGHGAETIGNISDLSTAETVKAQLKQLAVKAIEQGDDALLLKINDLISVSVDKASELVTGVASKVTGAVGDVVEKVEGADDSAAATEETAAAETTTEETAAAEEAPAATTEATTEAAPEVAQEAAAETVQSATEAAAPVEQAAATTEAVAQTVTVTPVQ